MLRDHEGHIVLRRDSKGNLFTYGQIKAAAYAAALVTLAIGLGLELSDDGHSKRTAHHEPAVSSPYYRQTGAVEAPPAIAPPPTVSIPESDIPRSGGTQAP